jgi:hypothetical protein
VSLDAGLEATVLRKITWRIMPFLFQVYVLSYLDRVNIGYAKLQFTGDLGLSIAYIGMLAGFGLFWSMSTTFLQGTAAVAGIAVINSIANLAGHVSPYVLGIVKDAMHSVTSWGVACAAGRRRRVDAACRKPCSTMRAMSFTFALPPARTPYS